MTRPLLTEIEIVGLFGAVELECGLAVPLARRVGTQRYLRLSHVDLAHDAAPEYSAQQIAELRNEGEVTWLAEPHAACRDAVAVYVTRSLLDACDWHLEELPPHNSTWKPLVTDREEAWAICCSEDEAIPALDQWARRIVGRTTGMLVGFLESDDKELCAEAERLLTIARCAARGKGARARVHVRSGLLAMLSDDFERVVNLYKYVVRRDFPDWDLADYQQHIADVRAVLEARVESAHAPPPDPSVHSLLDEAARIEMLRDEGDMLEQCRAAAERYREVSVSPEAIDEVLRRAREKATLVLSHDDRAVLMREPAFYVRDVFVVEGEAVVLDVLAFLTVLREKKEHLGVDEFGRKFTESAGHGGLVGAAR